MTLTLNIVVDEPRLDPTGLILAGPLQLKLGGVRFSLEAHSRQIAGAVGKFLVASGFLEKVPPLATVCFGQGSCRSPGVLVCC